MDYYALSVEASAEALATNVTTGLSTNEAARRLETNGTNELVGKQHTTFAQKFLAQLKDVMVIVLLIAATISFVISFIEGENDYIDSIIILLIVVFNAYLGALQESRAEASLDALKQMSAPNASVIRNGNPRQIPAKNIVVGDIIILEAGDLVPADGRLIESASLQSDESSLTGESVPIDKDATAMLSADAPLGDRINSVYAGCSITYGRGLALVTATGMDTEIGTIAELLNEAEDQPTPLQVKLNKLGKTMGIMALLICIIVFIFGVFTGEPPIEMFLTSISLAVAAIPEGLATVVTLVLALGVQRMVKEHAIIRKLPAVETLGSTSVICSDKTGTLTQNKMTVQKVWVAGGVIQPMNEDVNDDAKKMIMYSALCSDASITTNSKGKNEALGDPTEVALIQAAIDIGLSQHELNETYPRVGEVPFDSNRKLMSTVNVIDGKRVAIVKGGVDVLVPLCTSNTEDKDIAAANIKMGTEALRVLAIAYKIVPDDVQTYTSATLENNLTFLGLLGLIDPPRVESKDAIAVAKEAGIKTVMITGDHVVTASAIARELGILEHKDEAIDGTTLAKMTEQDLTNAVRQYAVYARVSPEDKIRIVRAWQQNDAVVAMTGDGVNDAPALKAADIGCAMGITGTEVAKDAAAMVLTDDNFSTIVKAIKEGRTIYDNIKKTIEFLLGSNIGEVLAVAGGILLGWGTAFTAIQLLLINVITDAFPAFALALEKPDIDTMSRKPTPRGESLFAHGLGIRIGLQGICVGVLALSAFYLGKYVLPLPTSQPGKQIDDLAQATGRTMAFLTLALTQLFHAYNCRSERSLFRIGIFSNKALNIAFLISTGITLVVALVPFFQNLFELVNLQPIHWLNVLGLSLSILLIVGVAKIFRPQR